MSSFFPCISEQSYFWVTLIFSGHGFGTSRLLFSFFYLKFLCLCYYYYYHYYHQIIFFSNFHIWFMFVGSHTHTMAMARSLAAIWRTIGFNEYYSFHWNYRSQQKWCKLQPKRSAGKKEGEVQNMVPTSNHVSAGRRDLGDFDQGRFRKPALFRRSLRLLRLKADTSRIKTCW